MLQVQGAPLGQIRNQGGHAWWIERRRVRRNGSWRSGLGVRGAHPVAQRPRQSDGGALYPMRGFPHEEAGRQPSGAAQADGEAFKAHRGPRRFRRVVSSGRRSMHVLYVYPNFTTPRGAWSTRAYDFARRWIEQGHRVTVVTGVYDKSDLRPTGLTWAGVVDGIEVRVVNVRLSNRHGLGRRVLTFLLLAAFASWHAARRPYDVALVSSGPLTLGIAGLAARWLRRRPFVFEVRDLFSDGLEQLGIVTNPEAVAGLRWFEGVCYRSATGVVALSETMAEWIRKRHGIRGIAVVPNAANIPLFDHDTPPPAEIAGHDAAFVFTGTMGRANDCGQLLQAARQLRTRGREDIHIYLVGDGQRRAALEAEALRDGLDHVHFIPPVPKEQLAGWLGAATAMVLTLKPVPVFDTVSPNKLFDAFAAGLPVIQTTQGWIHRVLADHDCGITVDATAPTALSDAMVTLADDRQRRDRMARNARRLASEVYSVDRLSNELLDTLVDALGPRRSTPAP